MANPAPIDPWLPEIFTVEKRVVENHDTITLTLKKKKGPSPLPPPKPGQFNMIYHFGVGEIPVSFSSIATDSFIHTIRNVGAVSNALFHSNPGCELGVRGPFGTHWDLEGAEGFDIIVVAGGVGIAPLKPLIETLIANKDRYGRIFVGYGARDPDNLLFSGLSSQWKKSIDFLRTVDTSKGATTQVWQEHVGVVPDLLTDLVPTSKARAFVCGPEIMMRSSIKRLLELGLQKNQIFLSMERNMKCAVGFCGHCQFGGHFICKDGPVFRYDRLDGLLGVREV